MAKAADSLYFLCDTTITPGRRSGRTTMGASTAATILCTGYTRLNSLVSHETMMVNEKFRSAYASQFKCFMFLGTNKPVKITDAKSGLIRRLIDVEPSGEKIPAKKYRDLVGKVDFELGAIAYKKAALCKSSGESHCHRL